MENSIFYPSNDYRSYLAHHGVKGMRWGHRKEKYEARRKRNIMKAYGITSKQYDSVRNKSLARHKKGNIVKGALIGVDALNMAVKAPSRIYQHKRDNFIALNDKQFDIGYGLGNIASLAIDSAVLQVAWNIGRNAIDDIIESKEFEQMNRRKQ